MPDDIGLEEEEFTKQINGDVVMRILKQVKPHWKWVLGFMASIGMVALIEAYFTFLNKRMIDEGILGENRDSLREIAIQYGVLILFFSVFVFGFIYLADILGQRVQYDLRKKMFDHLQSLSLSYFDKTPVGWIMSRITSDSVRISDLVTWGLVDIAWAIMTISTSFIFMFTISWQLSLVVACVLPVLIVVAIWFKQKILVEFRISRKINSKITGAYNENITGVRVVKALSREEANLDEFGILTDKMYRSSFRAAWLSALFLPIVQIISAVAVAIIVWYGGVNIATSTTVAGLTIGGLQAFISYIGFMLWPIQDVARVYAQMQQSVASAERIFSLLDAEPEIVDKPDAIDPKTIRGDIIFDHVDFYYEANKSILQDFNLQIKQGETIALVGPTGHGKSTIVNLLCRFYEPKAGTISFNGQDYLTMPLHAIHSRIGMVLQTPHLFSGTIRENIRYGRLDATDDEVIEAAKLASADPFITALNKSYDEEVGEGGVLLSVGQKQLISLARAILSNPELLVMDEATSSVDTITESLIQQGMDELMKDRTSFVIAHRLSTIKRADRIIVIEHGKIAEMGTHAELLSERGHYFDLYTRQFRDELEQRYQVTEVEDELELIPS